MPRNRHRFGRVFLLYYTLRISSTVLYYSQQKRTTGGDQDDRGDGILYENPKKTVHRLWERI
ncbi:protein of unknown function [Kyrpidia spormannii]|uniref:Uncharacterized protein n=1 Tax=Kyrpidia spormannii TaxID=2055160 RepID=A0A6F9EAY4_9BACL|nr:protein of unknown function [Kyrpidia spormannii]